MIVVEHRKVPESFSGSSKAPHVTEHTEGHDSQGVESNHVTGLGPGAPNIERRGVTRLKADCQTVGHRMIE